VPVIVIVPAELELLKAYIESPEMSAEFDTNFKFEFMLKDVFAVPM